jgi:hypothetical protein
VSGAEPFVCRATHAKDLIDLIDLIELWKSTGPVAHVVLGGADQRASDDSQLIVAALDELHAPGSNWRYRQALVGNRPLES